MAVHVRELNRIPMKVVIDDNLVVFDEPLYQVGADESGAAGDKDLVHLRNASDGGAGIAETPEKREKRPARQAHTGAKTSQNRLPN
jgi:hypothetical protein